MTEWRDNTGHSYTRVAEALLPGTEFVNLAEGGTGLPEYFANLTRYGERLKPQVVIIGLYLGNDLVPSVPPLGMDRPPQSDQTGGLKNWLKYSVLLNYMFRLGKLYIPSLRSGFFEKTVASLKARTGIDDATIARRLSQVDPALVEAARADAINGWDLAHALFDPNLYGDLAQSAPGSPKGEDLEAALKDLGTLIVAVRERNATAAVVLLPPPVWVAPRYGRYFQRLGYGELGPVTGPVPLIERIKTTLAAQQVPTLDILPVLRAQAEPVYLDNDIHLDRHGQAAVGKELAGFLVQEGLVKSR